MKILFINSAYNWGSTGKIVHSLFTSCQADGMEAAVCYGRIPAKQPAGEKNVFKFGLDWETYLHALLTRITGRTGCFSTFSTRRLLKYMDEFRPDVVNLHEPHAYFLNLKPFFSYLKKHNIPLVYTFHCEFAYTGRCGFAYGCENWKTGCGGCRQLNEYPTTFFFDASASMLKEKKRLLSPLKMTVVCPSKWLADRTKQSVLAGIPVQVIKNGINAEVFRPRDAEKLRRRLGLKDEKIILSVASDLSDHRKGLDYVLKLADRFRGENVRFLLVGKKGVNDVFPENVTAVGRAESQIELAEYYSLADCFVICSLMENLPTTCLEAVSCGTPVAGFDVGGTAETAPPPLGKFCPFGDLDALEANVRQLMNSAIDSALFEKKREMYSQEYMCKEYKKVYSDILAGSDLH